ncbi:MAG: biotin/lipoyl-containing protein, partial [Acidobacteriota bacterium]
LFTDPEGQRRSRYLDYGRLEEALKETGAEAAWVGWGFVAEHAEFADLCERLGIAFIGPSGGVMRLLGNKIAAKLAAERAGVPVTPWTRGPVHTLGEAREHCGRLGFPLMIKAAAGGGGRGIRRVLSDADLATAFDRARAEAKSAFGDPSVYFERVMLGVRHVEVQIIADCRGTTWALGLRDCTIQRRSQKILEEAPPAWVTPQLDERIREAAVRLCTAAGYENAGTVEFLADPDRQEFSFMEVNTRLQVEHPVTELTTGHDLVKLQLHVARGGTLDSAPPATSGHAIEVRLNAEDPDNGFAPSPGSLELLRLPTGPGIRVDTGFAEHDVVPPEFDSMIAKIIARGASRDEALARLKRALAQTAITIRGGSSNRAFLVELLEREEVKADKVDVGWLDHAAAGGLRPHRPDGEIAVLRAAIDAYESELEIDKARFYSSAARGRPEITWDGGRAIELRYEGQAYRLMVRRVGRRHYCIDVDDRVLDVSIECLGQSPLRERRGQGTECWLTCGGRRFRTFLSEFGTTRLIDVDAVAHRVTQDELGLIRAPSPSLVVSVAVKPGDTVAAGERLVVLEAMKMETTIAAPCAGTVRQIMVLPNTQVGAGTSLLLLEASAEAAETVATARLQFDVLQVPRGRAADRRREILDDLRPLVLGYDVDAVVPKRITAEWAALPQLDASASTQLLEEEIELLSVLADMLLLFHRTPGQDGDLDQAGHLSGEVYLFSYLRNLDASSAILPPAFLEQLQRTLSHYGVTRLDVTPALRESLFRLCRAHQREEELVVAALALLEGWLHPVRPLPQAVGESFRRLLDRLVAGAQGRHASLTDLSRELRYRYFERPLLERARQSVYADVDNRLKQLSTRLAPADRQRHVEALVQCPQPLAALFSQRFNKASGRLRQAMLEAALRRYYRIRTLENVRSTSVRLQTFVLAEYEHEGRRIHVFATSGYVSRLNKVLRRAARAIEQVPPEHDIVLDVFLWHRRTAPDRERLGSELCRLLNAAGFKRPLRRIVLAVSSRGPGSALSAAQYFTFRWSQQGYTEDKFYRDVHPMMAKRLHMWRFANFNLERLPSVEDIYLIHGVARDNPKDERLFALAEVRDLTPVTDQAGRIVQLPQLERMYLEALAGMRRFQVRRLQDRLHWNQVLMYVWPPFVLRPDELKDLASRMVESASGLGLETILLRARVPAPGMAAGTDLNDTVIEISNPVGRETVISFHAPADGPIRPLTEYEQQVVRLRQRSLTHPYELIRMLTPDREGIHTEFPPGEFVEYDLDAHGRVAPISRPPGRNSSNIVLGVIRNFTTKFPEGMTRVILVGDPGRDLGSLAEPECRRIIAGLELAERLQVPLEWIAVSAGAKISMDSGTENLDWIGSVLRRLVLFVQNGGEVNIIVNGINVGAQPYWN